MLGPRLGLGDCLGCAVLLCLVCLFDLACFFLSFFSSLIQNMHTRRRMYCTCIHVDACTVHAYTYTYMYMYVSWVRVPPEAAHFSRKSDFLGCAVLLCLVCLFDLACFFLSSFSSLIQNMYIH